MLRPLVALFGLALTVPTLAAENSETDQFGLVSYEPSAKFVAETGISSEEYNNFRRYLARRESQGYGDQPNSGGYMGRYQMSGAEIAGSAVRLGIPVPSRAQFLADPPLQEQMFEDYTLDHHRELMINPAYAHGDGTTRLALLAGAHLGGTGGIAAWERGQDREDSLGTHVSSYIFGMFQTAIARVAGVAVPQGDPSPSRRHPQTSPPSTKQASRPKNRVEVLNERFAASSDVFHAAPTAGANLQASNTSNPIMARE